jgi:hypothetical protein
MMDNARLVAEEVQIDLEGDDQGGALRLDQPNRIDELIARYDQVLDQVAVLEARIQAVLDGLVKPGVGVGAEGSAA